MCFKQAIPLKCQQKKLTKTQQAAATSPIAFVETTLTVKALGKLCELGLRALPQMLEAMRDAVPKVSYVVEDESFIHRRGVGEDQQRQQEDDLHG